MTGKSPQARMKRPGCVTEDQWLVVNWPWRNRLVFSFQINIVFEQPAKTRQSTSTYPGPLLVGCHRAACGGWDAFSRCLLPAPRNWASRFPDQRFSPLIYHHSALSQAWSSPNPFTPQGLDNTTEILQHAWISRVMKSKSQASFL